jgi:Domain of unknown function (DUF4386)
MINDEPRSTYSVIEPAQRTAARIVGLLYLVQMATGIFGQYVRDQLIVRGDAAKTALNITGADRLFRFSIAGDLITYILVIALIWALYILLRPVNKNLALLGVLFRMAENAILCVATINSLIVLKLLSGADYLKSFAANQLNSLVTLALGVQALAMNVGFILLGLGSTIFAYLLLKSGYVPKALAAWGIFASLVLALVTLGIMVFPALAALGLTYMVPMGIYEVGLGFWLLFRGLKSGNDRESDGIDDGSSKSLSLQLPAFL